MQRDHRRDIISEIRIKHLCRLKFSSLMMKMSYFYTVIEEIEPR